MRQVIYGMLWLVGFWLAAGPVSGWAQVAGSADALLPIGVIQGRGDRGAMVNERVRFRGVVTGVVEDRNAAGVIYYTLFVQDVPGEEDGDPATSDGIPVFVGRERPSQQPGDVIVVRGKVTEFYGLTEIGNDSLTITRERTAQPLPVPIPIRPVRADSGTVVDYEALEGMRVTFDGPARVVGPTFAGCGFAVVAAEEAVSGTGERPLRRQATDPIDQVLPILYHSDVSCAGLPDLKYDDQITGLTGPLTYHFDQFKLVLPDATTLQVSPASLSLSPQAPVPTAGQISIATFNTENYFDTIDHTGDEAEPKPTAAELATKQAKLVYTISHTLGCPTVLGVQEVENAPLLVALAEQLTAVCGFTYTVTHQDSPDARGIDVALLTDPRRVVVTAAALRQTCTPVETTVTDTAVACATGYPLFGRPPLEVHLLVDGQPLTVLVNHFKSKSGGDTETAPQRLAQGRYVAGLAADAIAQGQPVVVLGDLNDYEQSPALLALGDVLTNVLAQVPLVQRYSYNFGGASQLIDALLLSPDIAAQVEQVTIWHVNADYPESWATAVDPEHLPFRVTDHDLPWLMLPWAEPAPAPTLTPFPAATPLPTPTAVSTTNGVTGWVVGSGVVVVLGTAGLWWLWSKKRA